MSRRATIRASYTFLVFVVLILSSLGLAKEHKSRKKGSVVPAGTPVLWREPADIARRNLFLGPGGEAMMPDLRSVTLIEEEKGGYSKKYRVRDGLGRVWVAKIGKEAQSETAATRLLWAVGYFADADYLVPSVRIEGLNKTLKNVRFGARPKDEKRIDGWQWENNPFVGTREFRGLKVMMALINNWDIKESNNKIVIPKDHANELRYEVHDLGATFGKVSHIPWFIRFRPNRNDPKAYARARLVQKVKNGYVRFHYTPKDDKLFKDIRVADAQWIAGLLSRLSDQQITDAFRAANYSPEEVRLLTRAVRARVSELVDLPTDSRIATRPRKTRQ
jgi:hypothetical protein